jgi:hypothetical protein
MIKDTHQFHCAYELADNLESFAVELSHLLSDAKGYELKSLENSLIHLANFREAMIEIEQKVLARKELERIEEINQMEEVELQTVDGETVTFKAPLGFEVEPERTLYSYDLYDVQMDGDQILTAKIKFPVNRSLTSQEAAKCRDLFIKV